MTFLLAACLALDMPRWPPPSRDEVRRVVALVVQAAAEINPGGDGDDRTNELIRQAAARAAREAIRPRAFLVGLGVALDRGEHLRSNPVVGPFWQGIENADERALRLRSLSGLTLHGRSDWLEHYAISAALAAILNPEAAERLGVAKEMLDAAGESGFSFRDLAMDLAGIELAMHLCDRDRGPARLYALGCSFCCQEFVPDPLPLEEGLSRRRLEQAYGGPGDERFLTQCRRIRERAQMCPGLRALDQPRP